ncbi:MAG: hypothetical protein J6Z36_00265 [Clostridia bacterium]|nr:hypothetical protein [Clostridia bacterium]
MEILTSELNRGGYVKNLESSREYYETKIEDLRAEKQDNEAKIEALRAVDSNAFREKIAEYTIRNVDIDREITTLQGYLSQPANADTTAFEKKMTTVYDNIATFTETYTKISLAFYHNESTTHFRYTSIIRADGGIGRVFTILGSAVIGLIVAAAVTLAIYLPAYTRRKNQENALAPENKAE